MIKDFESGFEKTFKPTKTYISNGVVYYFRYGVGSTVFGSDCKVIESWRPVHTLRGHTGGKLHVFESLQQGKLSSETVTRLVYACGVSCGDFVYIAHTPKQIRCKWAQ